MAPVKLRWCLCAMREREDLVAIVKLITTLYMNGEERGVRESSRLRSCLLRRSYWHFACLAPGVTVLCNVGAGALLALSCHSNWTGTGTAWLRAAPARRNDQGWAGTCA